MGERSKSAVKTSSNGKALSAAVSSAPVRRLSQGLVIAIGGAEEKEDDRHAEILSHFVKCAGGKRARIVIVPTASSTPEETGRRYIGVFRRLGADEVEVLKIEDRSEANADPAVHLIEQASGIFVTGGDQARLVELLIGTRVMEAIRLRNAEGVIVAGTSAGASLISSHMLLGGTGVGGNSNGTAARKGMVEIVGGFGLLQDVIIDQHFSERGRMGRLMSVFAANPGLVAIGLDEDTAVQIDREGILETFGTGMVTLVDGRNATSDYFDRELGELLTVVNSSLHVLGPRQRFDLDTRQPADGLARSL